MTKPRSFVVSTTCSLGLLVCTALLGVSGALAGPLRDRLPDGTFDVLLGLCVVGFAGLTLFALLVAQCAVSIAHTLYKKPGNELAFWFAVGAAVLCTLVSVWGFDLGIGLMTGHPGAKLSQLMVWAAGAGLVVVKAGMFFSIAAAREIDRLTIAAAELAERERDDGLTRERLASAERIALAAKAAPVAPELPAPAPEPAPAPVPVRGSGSARRAGSASPKPRPKPGSLGAKVKAAGQVVAIVAGASAPGVGIAHAEPVAISQPDQRPIEARRPTWQELDQAEAALKARGVNPSQVALADWLRVRRTDIRAVQATARPD